MIAVITDPAGTVFILYFVVFKVKKEVQNSISVFKILLAQQFAVLGFLSALL